jgi:signal recognition particle subunit SRP54
LASRILGMGDVVGLMKDFEAVVDEKKAEEDARKLLKGKFTLEDFLEQIKTLKKVGLLSDIMEKFPMFGEAAALNQITVDDRQLVRIEALIHSMTPAERRDPSLINKSRIARIARGSGRQPADVEDLLSRFNMMKQLVQQLSAAPGLLGQLPGFKQLSTLSKLRGMDLGNVLGDMGKGLPGMPGAQVRPKGIPKGYTPPGTSPGGMARPPKAADKERSRNKRKAQKAARKKGRRK